MTTIIGNAPKLPNPPAQYDPAYINQLLGVIRVYFSANDSNISKLNEEADNVSTLTWMGL